MSGDCDLCGSYDHVETGCDAYDVEQGACASCGHDPACGFASVSSGDLTVWFCHDDDHSCYETIDYVAVAMKETP